jgi:hypothetical protein
MPSPTRFDLFANPPAPRAGARRRGWRGPLLAIAATFCLLLTLVVFSLAGSTARAPARAVEAPRESTVPPPEPPRPPASFYASPSGARTNDGTQARPLDLATALSRTSPLRGGDTLWLREGLYRGAFVSEIAGRADAPIYVKAYPGERVVLDGAGFSAATLLVTGNDVWFWNLEIAGESGAAHSTEKNSSRGIGVRVLASRTRHIGLVVHGALTGFSIARDAEDTELHGCIIFDNGVQDAGAGYGHGVYAEPSAGTTRLIDVITFANQGRGINIFAEGSPRGSVIVDGVASFDNGRPPGGDSGYKLENFFATGAAALTLKDSHFYHSLATTGLNVGLGSPDARAGRLTMTGTTIVGGSMSVRVAGWREAHVAGNLFYAQGSPNPGADQTLVSVRSPGNAARLYAWRANTYVDRTARRYPFVFNQVVNAFGGGNLSFPEWQQATGFDADSTYSQEPLAGTKVYVRESQQERGRFHAVVYNWSGEPVVELPLASTEIAPGDRIEVRDVTRLSGPPLLEAPYDGRAVVVPMTPPPDEEEREDIRAASKLPTGHGEAPRRAEAITGDEGQRAWPRLTVLVIRRINVLRALTDGPDADLRGGATRP